MRWIEAISRHAMTVAGWCYLAITGLITFDILARRLLGFSTEATTDIAGYLMAVGMSWGLAGTLLERGHVRIDVLVQKLPLRLRTGLHLASLAALLVASGFFVWGAVRLAKDSFDIGATDISSLRVPLAIPQGLWAAGLALLLLAGVALLLRSLQALAAGDPATVDRLLMARTYEDEAAETLDAVADAQAGMQAGPHGGAPGGTHTAPRGAGR